jgi:hypothetical protein
VTRHQWTEGDTKRILALVSEHGPDRSRIAAEMGLPLNAVNNHIGSTIRARYKAAVSEYNRSSRGNAPGLTRDAKRPDRATIEAPDGNSIRTLDDLLAYAKVDLTVWAVERFVVNKWAVGMKGPDGKVVTSPLFQVKAWLKRIEGAASVTEVWQEMLSDIAGKSRPQKKVPRTQKGNARNLLEIAVQDLHIGKLAWMEETGNDYDTKIAVDAGEAAITDLLDQARAYPLERILFLLGNDFFHYDNLAGTTTAGTAQDRDSRFAKMFLAGQRLATSSIERLAEVAPVEVMVIPGNHARIAEWNLGQVVDAWFRNDKRVTVHNSPSPRKYYDYGQTLLGFCHGDTEPHSKLPTIMPVEEPRRWSKTRYREWHLGHMHTSKRIDSKPVDGVNGVRVRILQSLSGTDKWHKDQGYVGEPGCAEAFVWNYERGLRANLFSNRVVR